ncbi:MAG: galactokinase, partial [Acidobacteria bacterium]|nr:galactokinase [Acidobacteriota bacterium]
RDISLKEVALRSDGMDGTLLKRARHIINENGRVLDSVDALRNGDMDAFGRFLTSSHKSLRDDFKVSSRELDLMVDIALDQKSVLGARMTGGGFGGCTINLMAPGGDQSNFAATVSKAYLMETGIKPEIYPCSIGNGAAEITF